MNGVQILLVMASALIIAAIAHRRGFQAGVVTVILGAVVSFVPGLPRLQLDPELILGAVVPPLLYSAVLNFSMYTFFQNFRGIVGLGVGLVAFTTVVVGYLSWWVEPELGLAGAFVLAAVVSPPDTITTISHGRELGIPRRIVSVLTGESLVNDAAALTLFALAVSAVTGETGFITNPFLLFGWEALIGLIIGLVLGLTASAVRATIGDPTIEAGFNLLVPFLAYLAAEQVEASGIIAVVAAGFTVSIPQVTLPRGGATSATTYRTRLQEAALWPVINLGLETFVFAYIGLQLRFVLEDLAASDIAVASTIRLGMVVLLVVILCRFVYVYASYARRRPVERHHRGATQRAPGRRQGGKELGERQLLTNRESLLVSWTGMRGIITLAAAGSIPETISSGAPFPGRTTIQTVAFIVAIGTLLLQGVTLPYLVRRLNIDTSQEDAAFERTLTSARRLVTANGEPSFEKQREALALALQQRRVDPATARLVLHEIDLRQAAANPMVE